MRKTKSSSKSLAERAAHAHREKPAERNSIEISCKNTARFESRSRPRSWSAGALRLTLPAEAPATTLVLTIVHRSPELQDLRYITRMPQSEGREPISTASDQSLPVDALDLSGDPQSSLPVTRWHRSGACSGLLLARRRKGVSA